METPNLHFISTAVRWVQIYWTAGWKHGCKAPAADWSRVVMQQIRVNPPPPTPNSVLILLLDQGHLPSESCVKCVCVWISEETCVLVCFCAAGVSLVWLSGWPVECFLKRREWRVCVCEWRNSLQIIQAFNVILRLHVGVCVCGSTSGSKLCQQHHAQHWPLP